MVRLIMSNIKVQMQFVRKVTYHERYILNDSSKFNLIFGAVFV